MPQPTGDPVQTFLGAVRQVRASGLGTAEQSYYPAVNMLLSQLGAQGRPARQALAHPAGVDGDFPDVALYELSSNVLVLPVEVKPADTDLDQLIRSAQASRYARTFGGGTVLVTNLREFALGRLDASGKLQATGRVTLAPDAAALDRPAATYDRVARELQLLLDDGCQVRGAITDPALVARLLAYHARHMRDAITGTGDVDALLAPISAALRDGLQIDLPANLLAPTVVQTLVYGLFAAWLESDEPGEFNWMDTAYRLEVPVFADVLHAALRPQLVRASRLTVHLEALARVLAWTDQTAFAARFDGDAIEYFYEPFLAEFDPALRGKLGVWYTPREIAEYQVARADHHLKHDLGLAAGLADPSVYILDPACGTGTYLGAVLRHIHSANLANGEPEAVAAERAREAAVSRVLGFEILPAAFIISHLHLGRLLHRLGAAPLGADRLRVYLTNALTGWDSDAAPVGETLFPELEEELRSADAVKHHDPVLVVLGNPPYEGYSTAETEEERRMLAPWIEPLWPQWQVRKHRLNDLYVRFWRVAIERIATLTGRGVVSFITNRKWLAGRSYPAMREAVVTSFQHVRVDDLHGSTDDVTHPGDQSIFTTGVAAGIKRGTAIVTAIRTGPPPAEHIAEVAARDLWGTATVKRAELTSTPLDDRFQPVPVTRKSWWRLTTTVAGDDAPIDDYLTFYRSGIQPVRDAAVLDVDESALRARMQDYFDATLTLEQLVTRHPGFGVTRQGYEPAQTRRRLLQGSSYRPERVVKVLYRPFDVRWLYWEPDAKLLNRPRPELIPFWANVPHQRCLVLPQTPRRAGAVRPVVSRVPAYFAAAEPDARLFPLYRPPSLLLGETAGEFALDVPAGSDDGRAETLVSPPWCAAARRALDLPDDTAAGEAVFYALVAVMHSPAWLARQPTELDDFPEVPLPRDPVALTAAVDLGRRIADLTDPTVAVPGVTSGQIEPSLASIAVPDTIAGPVVLAYGSYGQRGGQRSGQDVLWAEGRGWRNIPQETWAYSACGFAVLPKWLSYRLAPPPGNPLHGTGHGLRPSDRQDFMLLARRIAALLAVQADCDAAYAAAVIAPLEQ